MISLDRREFLASVAAASALRPDLSRGEPTSARLAPATVAGAMAFRPLPLGAVRPSGWTARQLRIMADGLSGHLDEFWPDVADSQWFGGKAEGWERAPYWLDGAIPLAWLLDDATLKARITAHVDHVIANQRADGWFAPLPAGRRDESLRSLEHPPRQQGPGAVPRGDR